jgi:membrane-associated phospholipid phosphatase
VRTVHDVARTRGATVVSAAHAASWLGRSWIDLPLAILVGWSVRRAGRGWVPACAVAAAIVAQNVVKEIVRRPRPTPPSIRLEHVTSWSFPSGHATESTALFVGIAIAMWPLLDSRAWRATVAAAVVVGSLMVAGSRVVLGVHYPTDAATGVVLGLLAAVLSAVAGRESRPRAWLAASAAGQPHVHPDDRP